MMPSGDDTPRWVRRLLDTARTAEVLRRCGTVTEVVGLTIQSQGPITRIGEMCTISRGGGRPPLPAEVCGFRSNR
ncbi:MAG: hypothetical protein J7M38_07440, partial [Armatimonadetes bacterium]|nr:hypothetical protein [Armatimonadota bacterium]